MNEKYANRCQNKMKKSMKNTANEKQKYLVNKT